MAIFQVAADYVSNIDMMLMWQFILLEMLSNMPVQWNDKGNSSRKVSKSSSLPTYCPRTRLDFE